MGPPAQTLRDTLLRPGVWHLPLTGYDSARSSGLGNTLTLHKAICAIRMVRGGMNEPNQCKPLNNSNMHSQQRISCVSLTHCPKCKLLIEVTLSKGILRTQGPRLPKTSLRTGAELWFPSIPFGPCFSLGGVLMFQWFCPGVCCPHRVQKAWRARSCTVSLWGAI